MYSTFVFLPTVPTENKIKSAMSFKKSRLSIAVFTYNRPIPVPIGYRKSPNFDHPTKLLPLQNLFLKMQLTDYSDWESNNIITCQYLTLRYLTLNYVFNLEMQNIFT
jgi:hypothetical protein